MKTYTELIRLESFVDRLKYLRLYGSIGSETFGYDRYINQSFYRSREWKQARDAVISRDYGRDLGVIGYEIAYAPLVHHINPMGLVDIVDGDDWVLNPEFLITTTRLTHNAIHFGDENGPPQIVVERSFGDTKLW
jgi:hypothetical protein